MHTITLYALATNSIAAIKTMRLIAEPLGWRLGLKEAKSVVDRIQDGMAAELHVPDAMRRLIESELRSSFVIDQPVAVRFHAFDRAVHESYVDYVPCGLHEFESEAAEAEAFFAKQRAAEDEIPF